ncbi:MAG: hypothetical protein IT318_09670 [Anaerolineales bacterium]|nr:hypothetical protein [Anaerolineales bacterium]
MALLGAAVLLVGTRWGVGASPDSAVYIGAAQNLLSGRGLTVPFGGQLDGPLTHFPPLYPILLAGLGQSVGGPAAAARWLAAVLFGANVLLAAVMVANTRSTAGWAPLAGAGLLLVAPTMVSLHSMAWSEPLFLLLGFSGLLLLAVYQEQGRWPALLAAGALLGLVTLTRYAGVAFVAAGVLALVALPGRPRRARLAAGLVLGAVSMAPLLAWSARNLALAGSATSRQLVFHPIGLGHARQALDTLAGWLLLPLEASTAAKLGVPLALVGGIAAIAAWHRRQAGAAVRGNWPGAALAAWPALIWQLILFSVVYVIFLAGSISLVDANTPLDDRILSPLYPAGAVVAAWLAGAAWPSARRARWPAAGLLALAAAFVALSAVRSAGWLAAGYEQGIGFNRRAWQASPSLMKVQALPEGSVLYSNAPEAIYLHTGRGAYQIPRQFSPVSQTMNGDYAAELAEMRRRLGEGGFVVYFAGVRSSSGPSEAELVETLALQVTARTADGTLYALASRP